MNAGHKGRLWGAIGVLAVLVLWGVSAVANFWAGWTLSEDPALKAISGGASVAVDILKAVSLFVIAAAISNRRWVVMGTAVVILLLCSAWSLRSAVYTASVVFGTADAERVHKAEVAEGMKALTAVKQQRLGFLGQQKIDVDSKTKRSVVELATDANKRTATEFNKLSKEVEDDLKRQAESPAGLPKDPIAWMFGLDSTVVITATALFFALLVEITSGTGFWVIAQSRLPKEQAKASRPKVEKAEKLDPPTNGGTQLLSNTYQLPTAPNVVHLPIPSRLSPRAILAEALEDVVEPADPKERVLTSVVNQRAKVRLPEDFRFANHQNVSMMVLELLPGARKKKVGGQMYFYGVKLKDPAAKSLESRQAQLA
jgi:hypothetical protein